MSEMEFEMHGLDTARVLSLRGRLNLLTAPELRSVIDALVESGTARVVVDLSKVTFMDSSGLGALVAGLKRTRQAGGDLRVAGPNEQVLTVLRLTNLDRVIRPYDTVAAASDDW